MPSIDNTHIALQEQTAFGSGGNRLCYRHPSHPERCLKVARPDRTPEIRRAQKGFPANLRPLSTYDENLVEQQTLQYLHDNYPKQITAHLPKSYGIVETDLGSAHETDLICDANGLISQTLEQYVWDNGLNEIAEQAIDEFKANWSIQPPNTRDLIPHNFVIQIKNGNGHLILIDGYGRKPRLNLPFNTSMPSGRLKRRMQNFDKRTQLILERKASDTGPMDRINNLKRSI